MKQIRMTAFLLAAALLLSLCCVGCAKDPIETAANVSTAKPDPALTETLTENTEATEPIPADVVPERLKNGGKLRFLPEERLRVPTPSEMVYTRPDTEKLIADLEALTEKVPGCNDAEALLKDYYSIVQEICDLETMDALALYRYSLDMSDDFYAEEYDFCEEQYGIEAEKEDALYAAFAASPCRDALEQAYFGEGFFRDYDDFNTADESYFEWKQQEKDLLFQYYELSAEADFSSSRQIELNHEAAGGIFIELVKVRQQLAAAKGYENYMDYSYACDFQRDYTTALARDYLDQLKTWIAPLMQNKKIANQYSEYSSWDESKAMKMLSAAAERMGGPIWESYRFLSGHELYDIASAPNKMSIGYTTYFDNYEAPFIFVDPDTKDLVFTLFHEFGHFTDWYRNYCIAGDYETGETYSQAMQYLAFAYAEPFTDRAREKNLRATLSDLLIYSVLQEGAFGDFELRVYAMAPEELTVEKLDEVFGQCLADYGLAGLSGIRFKDNFWSVYQHFFAYPGYVISYSNSAVAAMQICRLEAEEPGAGVKAFCRLLDRTHGKKFAAVLAEAGLDSPFEAATLEKTAEFLKQVFEMD